MYLAVGRVILSSSRPRISRRRKRSRKVDVRARARFVASRSKTRTALKVAAFVRSTPLSREVAGTHNVCIRIERTHAREFVIVFPAGGGPLLLAISASRVRNSHPRVQGKSTPSPFLSRSPRSTSPASPFVSFDVVSDSKIIRWSRPRFTIDIIQVICHLEGAL